MPAVDDLLKECAAAVQAHGSRSIRARDLLRQLFEARNKALKKEIRAMRRKRAPCAESARHEP